MSAKQFYVSIVCVFAHNNIIMAGIIIIDVL